jgi:hypothetical protein
MLSPTEWERITSTWIGSLEELIGDFKLCPIDEPGRSIPFSEVAENVLALIPETEPLSDSQKKGVGLAAAYFVMRIIPDQLTACYTLLTAPQVYESWAMLRSCIEALDLVEYFLSDRCTQQAVTNWLTGGVIANRETRKAATRLNIGGKELELSPSFLEEPYRDAATEIVQKLRAKQYRILSQQVHHALGAIRGAASVTAGPPKESYLAYNEFNGQLLRSVRYWRYYFVIGSDSNKSEFARSLDSLISTLEKSFFDEEYLIAKRLATHYHRRRSRR